MKRSISKKHIFVLLAAFLAAVFLGFSFAPASASGSAPLSRASVCVYASSKQSGYLKSLLSDSDYDTKLKLGRGDWVSVRWDAEDIDFVYFEWTDKAGVAPSPYSLELLGRDGEALETRVGDRFWNCGTQIGEDVFGVRIRMEEEGELCTLIPYSGGSPSDYHPWLPTQEKADFLVIATHPDDDTLFMGAMVPTYGAERGLSGSILYMTTRRRVRRTEALNGAWIMGLRTYPLMAGMRDVSASQRPDYGDQFKLEDVERVLVRYIRRMKPEVIMTHDAKGEYGHWQHVVVSEAARLAVVDAADPAYDPSSYSEYGAWQVKKLYIHLSKTSPIFISATVPLEAFGGLTAWEIAQSAYRCHQSQNLNNHPCNNSGVNSLERFGLVFSTVGEDTGINDMFENIDPEALSNFEPTPEPTAEPTPTPAPPTEAPVTEAPTAEPTPVPTPEPTSTPTEATAQDNAEDPSEAGRRVKKELIIILSASGAALAVLLAVLIAAVASRGRKNR